eukprot:scaffold94806_cov15-Prasinocladus_malaysianus.AAC.1
MQSKEGTAHTGAGSLKQRAWDLPGTWDHKASTRTGSYGVIRYEYGLPSRQLYEYGYSYTLYFSDSYE